MTALSIVVPTFCREKVLVDTIGMVLHQIDVGDELLVIDQTPNHEPATTKALEDWAMHGQLRWYRKLRPGQSEATNVGALLARNEGLVFLDDDVEPQEN
jgi:glycosyltransferase involved in cell wall biosynthesis